MGKLAKLKSIVDKAGRWLGLTAPVLHTAAVAADRFDDMTWRETLDQAGALQELIDTLAERHDYAADLVRDLFLAAYKAGPALHDRTAMDPTRLVNHQIVTSMLEAPEFEELRRESVGDPYVAAMAVLSMASKLERLLDQAKQAQDAAGAAAAARQAAAAAGQAVEQAVEQATGQADDDGNIPAAAARAVQQAIGRATSAEQTAGQADQATADALAAIVPAIRAAIRAAVDDAAEQAREEAALMLAWGVDPGRLERMPFEQRRRLAERLRNNRLGAFTKLIGRFRHMAAAERARKVEHGHDELIGIEQSDDLGRLIPSELASLGVPALRGPFVVRMTERRLYTYQTRGEDRVGQGAILAVVDCSGSMAKPSAGGMTREAWAKACALALLDQARTAKRDFVGILFATASEIKVFRFPGGQAAIEDVLDFAEFFWNGAGTNFETPLGLAVDLLEGEYNQAGKQRGDLVFITDGECAVSEPWMRDYQERKTRLGFRTFGMAMGREPGPVLEAVSDNVRGIRDLAEVAAVRDVFRAV